MAVTTSIETLLSGALSATKKVAQNIAISSSLFEFVRTISYEFMISYIPVPRYWMYVCGLEALMGINWNPDLQLSR